jgi:hypothetical protein
MNAITVRSRSIVEITLIRMLYLLFLERATCGSDAGGRRRRGKGVFLKLFPCITLSPKRRPDFLQSHLLSCHARVCSSLECLLFTSTVSSRPTCLGWVVKWRPMGEDRSARSETTRRKLIKTSLTSVCPTPLSVLMAESSEPSSEVTAAPPPPPPSLPPVLVDVEDRSSGVSIITDFPVTVSSKL